MIWVRSPSEVLLSLTLRPLVTLRVSMFQLEQTLPAAHVAWTSPSISSPLLAGMKSLCQTTPSVQQFQLLRSQLLLLLR